MLTINDLKAGGFIKLDNEPYEIISLEHVKVAQSHAIKRTKVKNLITGHTYDKTFKNVDKFEEAQLSRRRANFLYKEGRPGKENYFFMDNASYDQFSLSKEQIGEKINYIKEGSDVDILNFEEQPININIPTKIALKVRQTSEGVRGDTAQGSVQKEAILETGHKIKVPLFVKTGDTVLVNTESGKYLERVKK